MTQKKINLFDRIFFAAYHFLVLFMTLFGFNYLSLPKPDLLAAFQRMTSMDRVVADKGQQQLLERPSLTKLQGDVRVFEDQFSGSERPAMENDILRPGYTVETKEKSSVVMNFGHSYQLSIRLLPSTKLRIDELKTIRQDGETRSEFTLLHLLTGDVVSSRTNPSPAILVDVKTKLTRYSLMASRAAVSTDGSTYFFATVKDGNVRAENLKTLKYEMLKAGESVYLDHEGKERKTDSPDLLKLFEWDLQKFSPSRITADLILHASGGPFVETADEKLVGAEISEPALAELEEQLSQTLKVYAVESQEIHEELVSEKAGLEDLRKKQEKEALKVYADINCLETTKNCDLYSEKLLLSRGFVRLHNSSRMTDSIVKDLHRYLDEQRALRDERQKKVDDLVALETKRADALTWAQSRQADKSQIRDILRKLTDPSLTP